MKKIIILIFLLAVINFIDLYSQPSQTLIATISNGVATLSVSEQTLENALQQEMNDGTSFNQIEIKYKAMNQTWYIFAHGTIDTNTINISWDLRISGSNLYVNNSSSSTVYSGCKWVSCDNCGSTPADCPDGCPPGEGHGGGANCVGSSIQKTTTDGHIGSFY